MRKRCFSFLAILGGVLLALGRTEARQPVSTNLAAYWPMDSFASNATPDATAGAHHAAQATAANQPATAAGVFAGALSFDGSADFLSAPDSAGLNVGTGSFTVAAWVKPAGTTMDRIVNKWNGTIGWLFDINTGSGAVNTAAAVRLKMSDGTNTVDLSTNASLVAGAWTHIAVTVDRTANQLKFYANGVQVGTTGSTGAMTGTLTNAAALGIGSIPSALGNYYAGALDEVRFYTAALTQPQVMTLVVPPAPTGLTATPVAQTQSIDLSWTASAGAATYRVYRSTTSGSGYLQIAAGLTGTTYTDSPVDYDVTYYYVVRGFGLVETANSNEAFAMIGPRPPRGAVADDNAQCGIGAGSLMGSTSLIAGLAVLAMVLAAGAFRRSA